MIAFPSSPRRSASLVSVLLMLVGLLSTGCGSHPVTGTTVVSQLRLTADSASVNAGSTTQLHATSTDSNNKSTDVTSSVNWSSSTPTVAAVSSSGMLTGLAAGSTTIAANLNGVVATMPATIGAPAVTGLVLFPSSVTMFTNGKQTLTALATYANNTTGDATNAVQWSVTPSTVATMSASGVVTAIAPGAFLVTATAGTQKAFAAGSVINAPLETIAVTPGTTSMGSTATQQFTVTGTFADKATADLTADATWTSSNPSLLTISATGLAKGVASATSGTATVTARVGMHVASATVQISKQAALTQLIVEPTSSSIAVGTAEQHQALALYADGTQQDVTSMVTWSMTPVANAATLKAKGGVHALAAELNANAESGDVATVDSTGTDWAMNPGMTQVQATYGGTKAESVVIVTSATIRSLSIRSISSLFPAGSIQALSLIGKFSDGTSQDLSLTANWQSSNPAVATVDAKGNATGLSAGPVVFTASFGGLTTQTVGYEVLSAALVSTTIQVDYPAVAVGRSENLRLIGNYADGSTHDLTSLATWTSANPSVFSIDSTGLAYGTAGGSTQVTGTVNGRSAITNVITIAETLDSLDVLPTAPRMALGTTLPLSAIAHFSTGLQADITRPAVWVSAEPLTLTINAAGVAKAGSVGTTTVTATLLGKTQISAPIEVTDATIVSLQLSAAHDQLAAGTGQQYTATGIFSDGSFQDISSDVIWTSSDETIASLNKDGLVSTNKAGSVQVMATFEGETVSAELKVTNATLLSTKLIPGNTEIPVTTRRTFQLIGTFSDATTQDLSYNTIFIAPTPSIVTLGPIGIGLGVSPGIGQITAQRGYYSASTPVTVTNAVLTGIALTPASATIRKGTQKQLVATGTYSDGFTVDLQPNSIFTSSAPRVASVSNAGWVAGTGLGSAQISASYKGITATTTGFSVLSNVLSLLDVSPANPSLLVGGTQQLTATGTYNDGTTEDVTAATTWTSSNPLLVSISKSGVATALGLLGRDGLAAFVNPQPASVPVTASSGGQSKTVNVMVLPGTATLTSVAVSPSTASFAKGLTQQFMLTGTYSDGSTQDLTSQATWASSNAAVATISAGGLATGAGVGAVQLSGTYNGKTASTGTVNVTPAVLASIAVSPASPSFAKGTTTQFTVTGTYTDGTTADLTGSSTYASSNTGVVSVSSAGLALGVGTGSAQVTITSGGKTVTTGTVQVTPATVSSITVNPTSAHAAAGTTVQMSVTGTYTDGSTGDVTSSAAWTSSSLNIATVNAAGLVTGVTPGLASITATVGTLTNTGVVRVGAATLVSTAISPSGASFAAGTTQKFTLTGTFTDGSTQDLSSSATWSTSNAAAATVDGTGLATGVAPGSVAFTAVYNGMSTTTPTITVQPATLVSIAVTPSSPSFAKGTTTQFRAIGTYSDGSTRDLTGTAVFSSSDPSVVSISNGGLGQGLAVGSVQITVSAGGQTAMTQSVTVTPATLSSVVITPSNPSLAAGTSQQFTATGTFSDGTTQDLSSQVVWTSSNPQVMTIGQLGLASTFQTGSVSVSATINGMTVSTPSITVSPAVLQSIAITPTTAQVAKGTVRQFRATGTYTDGTMQDVSSMVMWTSSNGSVVSIDANGLATGTGIGSAVLTATLGGKTVSTNSFMVTPATLVSLGFNPAHPTVGAGSNSQISVIGTFSDGSTQDLTSQAMFSSSNTGVATISSTGAIAGVAPGTSTISVTANGVTSSFDVAVSNATLQSIAITPANPAAFAKGTQQQFMAVGTYSDGTTQDLSTSATWTSSNPAVFTIDRNGLATGTGVGSAQLTASYQGQTAMTGSVQVAAATVSSLTITPGNATFAVGSTQQYTALATYSDNTTADVSGSVTWSSSNAGVISINSTGFATGMGAGVAMVQAQYQGLSGAVRATINQAAATLQQVIVSAPSTAATVGGMKQFSATAVYSDGSTMDVTSQAVWSSTNPSVATVNSAGVVSLLSAGTATIQGQFNGVTGSVTVNATTNVPTLQSLAITPSAASVARGLTQQFTATGTYSDGSTQDLTAQVAWTSSNTTFATINASGLAQSIAGGQTQIAANYQGQTAQVMLTVSAATLQSLAISPSTLNLANGTKQQMIAIGTLSDGSTQDFTTSVNWSSSNTSDATVSASGVVSSVGVGPVTITAQAGGVSRSVSVNVTAATPTSIQLTPTSVTVPVGGVQQFQATAMFSDGTSQDVTNSVTYTTSNPSVVTVDANGNLHGVGTGTATVTATIGSTSTTATVNITQVALQTLAITPANLTLADGLSQQLTATGTFADGSTQNLTNTVTWTSSNPQVASVSSTGKLTVTGVGSVTITATTDSISATDAVTGTAAAVTAITVTPATTTLAAGQTQQFAATATFTDGSQQTVTSSANWSVSDPTKGSISNSGSTKGFLTTMAAGSVNVVATMGTVNGTVPVTVQPAALTVLRITPSPVNAAAGTTKQLTVTGSYTDGSTADVTASAVWTSGSASVATVSAAGLMRAITPGSTTLQAMVGSTTTTVPVTVSTAALNSIAVTPTTTSLAKGLTQQLTATGTYTDGSTADITSQVAWSSSAPSVATVSSTGLMSTLATGNSTLTAMLNGVSQTASVTVTSAVLQSIAVTATQGSFALGQTLQLTATGTYSDGTTQNLTNSATWTSTAPAVGMVSATGLATGRTAGTFTARAAVGGVSGSLPLTVTAAVLTSIAVTPANTIIVNVLGTTQFTATGTFSDGTTQNLTNSVHWAVTGPVNVGTINQQGQLSGVHAGVAGTVTATLGTVVGSTGFTVVGVGR